MSHSRSDQRCYTYINSTSPQCNFFVANPSADDSYIIWLFGDQPTWGTFLRLLAGGSVLDRSSRTHKNNVDVKNL